MTISKPPKENTTSRNDLPPAAIRALNEASERREKNRQNPPVIAKEVRGRKGPEPVRYGDWEKNGIVSDF